MNRFNLSLFIVLVLLIAGLWTCNSCQKAKIAKLEGRDVVQPVQSVAIHFDTIKVRSVDTVTRYIPKPYEVTRLSFEHVDTAAILQDYFSAAHYRDSVHTKYGTVIIQDTVFKDRIAGRSVVTDFTIPFVTKTITNTAQAKPRAAVFLGLNFQGNANDYVQAFGPSISLKTKQDRVIELGALYNMHGQVIYQAGIKFKISFTKN